MDVLAGSPPGSIHLTCPERRFKQVREDVLEIASKFVNMALNRGPSLCCQMGRFKSKYWCDF